MRLVFIKLYDRFLSKKISFDKEMKSYMHLHIY